MARITSVFTILPAIQNVQRQACTFTLINCSKRNYSNAVQAGNLVKECDNSGVVSSPFPSVEIIKQTLVEYVWKNTSSLDDLPSEICAVSGRSYTFGMTKLCINKLAQGLLTECKLQPGDIVALLLPNIPEFVIVSHGVTAAGMIASFANPLHTPEELKRQFESIGVKSIVTIPMFLNVCVNIASQLPNYRTTICVGSEKDSIKNVTSLQDLIMENYTTTLPSVNPDDIAVLPFSSGTTGLPKGVKLTHSNLVSNLMQGDHVQLSSVRPDEIGKKALTVLPLFHIYGFNAIMNTCLNRGLPIVTLPKFTPEDYIKALIEHRPHFLFVVPSILLFLASHPSVTKDHLASVKLITSGAAPASEGLLQRFREKIGEDVLIRQGYGMTETSPVALLCPRSTPLSKKNTVGVLFPNTEAKIVSLTNGEVLGPHQPGELFLRGPQVMAGYLNNEKATNEIFTNDGWLKTGDVVYYDNDGYFYIVDRCKELIKVKGNQVSPTELENVILEIPGVADVAVVGILDDLSGELPKAFVVKKNLVNLTEEDIVDYIKSKVAPYKQLRGGVKFIDLIPRNPAGKILRNELKIV